jgi:hypothetical protein
MTDLLGIWGVLLFAGKWLFLGLIYLALFIILGTVRQEARGRLAEESAAAIAPGRLRVLQGGGDAQAVVGRALNLQPVTTLGAGSDNTFVLGDPYVSAHHARLTWDGAEWWVEDLNSANGTSVNGRPCRAHVRCPLFFGARVSLGDVVLELVE